MTDLNPQAKEMADESMVRNLDAQARAIWPQESALFRRYGVPEHARILDAGCGTGEVASRLAVLFPGAEVLGVDIIDAHLELARSRYASIGARLRFEHQSIFELDAADDTYDLVVCRHVLHSVPHPDRVVAELARVTKPGGRLHLLPEDYGMLHFQRGALDPSRWWLDASSDYGQATETDLYIGRNTYSILYALGCTDVTVDYVIVDTVRVPRDTFASILEAWRDGYVDSIAGRSRFDAPTVRAHFDQMIADLRNPARYAAWFVPILAAKVS